MNTPEKSLAQLTLRNLELRRAEGNQNETDRIAESYDYAESDETAEVDSTVLHLRSADQNTHAMGVRQSAKKYWGRGREKGAYDRAIGKYESCAFMTKAGIQPKDSTTPDSGSELQCVFTDHNATIENYVTRQGDDRYKDGGGAGTRFRQRS